MSYALCIIFVEEVMLRYDDNASTESGLKFARADVEGRRAPRAHSSADRPAEN